MTSRCCPTTTSFEHDKVDFSTVVNGAKMILTAELALIDIYFATLNYEWAGVRRRAECRLM